MRSVESVISQALFHHQGWDHSGAPEDECDCCARWIIEKLAEAGLSIVPTVVKPDWFRQW